jgi:hypothetical protein
VKHVDEAGKTIAGIVSASKSVSGIIGKIRVSSAEQFSSVKPAEDSVKCIDRATQQNVDLVAKSDSAPEGPKKFAQGLVHSVAVFELGARNGAALNRPAGRPAHGTDSFLGPVQCRGFESSRRSHCATRAAPLALGAIGRKIGRRGPEGPARRAELAHARPRRPGAGRRARARRRLNYTCAQGKSESNVACGPIARCKPLGASLPARQCRP